MKLKKLAAYILIFFLVSICGTFPLYPQSTTNTVVTGIVTDSETGQPLPFVTIILENTSTGTLSDLKGRYSISTSSTSYRIIFSFVGYNSESHVIFPGKTQEINIRLVPATIEIDEITVKPGKRNYSNKNNPAVDLINKVIDHKSLNRMENLDFYKYSRYEKLAFSLSNLPENFRQPKAFNKFRFLLENVDTTRLDGKKNIPIYLKETGSDVFCRKEPRAVKEVVNAEKNISMDEYIDNKGLTANIKYLYQDIDIYDNEIFFLSNKFLGPLASTAPVFYRYYIIDTSMVNNTSCIQVFFEPRNPADFLFHGFLFITADSSYAIKKIDMSFNKKINIDWVNDARLVQDFEKTDGGAWVLTRDDISVDFGISQKMVGMYGEKVVYFTDYIINEPIEDSIFRGPQKIEGPGLVHNSTVYWDSARVAPLTTAEARLYTNIDSVREMKAFRRRMDIVMLLTTEFLNLGKFELGPVGNTYSFNTFEGSRIRFGGRTTYEFNNRIYFDSYLAYGFKDEQFKYNLGATYSLSGKTIYKFPVKSVRLGYQYDTETPGQGIEYSAKDDILMSLKRGVDDKVVYNRSFRLEYLNEFQNHFSYDLGFHYTEQTPGGNLVYTADEILPFTNQFSSINISEAFLKLRYAPKEEYYQGKLYRAPIASKYPVIIMQGSIGSKNLYNDFDYQKLRFEISKRFYFSIVGYTDIAAEAGKIFGQVPFPLLFIHDANQTYAYQKNSYNMMNFLEFVSDEYASLNIDHSFNGFFFNKIPLLKRLKLREVATFKMLYGGVSRLNDPQFNPGLFRFPVDATGAPTTFSLEQKPYIEASIGMSNILRIFRVDLIKRITYLNNPNVSSLGVRVQFRFDI